MSFWTTLLNGFGIGSGDSGYKSALNPYDNGSNSIYSSPTPSRVDPIWGGAGAPLEDNTVDGGYQPSTTDQIMAQLQALQDPSRYLLSQDQLEQQAMSQAAAQYDPLINELQRQIGLTTNRANQNKDIIGSMFNQLADRTQADLPVINQQYADSKNAVNTDYQNANNQINDIYNQTQKDQEDLYKRLNIQAAAPDVIPQQERDKAFLQGIVTSSNNTAQNALNQEQQGAQTYTTQSAEGARAEGTQRQADLMQQLQDYLTEAQGKIGDYNVAKQNAYTTGLGQLLSQNQTSALQRAQQDFQNYIASINLGRGLQQDQLNLFNLQNKPVQSLGDVSSRAIGLGLPPQSAQNIQDIFSSALLQDAVSGGASGVNLSPEAKAAAIVQQGRQANLSQAELNALQDIALEYFGRR